MGSGHWAYFFADSATSEAKCFWWQGRPYERWETEGARSVRNDIKIKEKFNFQQSAKDLLITSQLRTALIINKQVKATNYQIDTYKKKIYVYGIALTLDEKSLVVQEAKEILDVEDVIASILLVEDLRIQKN